jgi:hypothetical protein
MKKLLLSAVLILTCLTGFAQRFTSQDFVFVGQEHNQYLDKVYNYIVSNNLSGRGTLDRAKDYLISQNNASSYSESCKRQGVININQNIRAFGRLANLYPGTSGSQLSSAERQYLDQLYTVVVNETLSVADFKNRVTAIEGRINTDTSLNNTQLATLYSATNVAKYSYEYWSANSQRWSQLDGPQADAARACCGDGVGGADVGGAVGAAVTTWAANAVPGAGQIGYGGAIVVGAAAASLGKAFENLVNSWF